MPPIFEQPQPLDPLTSINAGRADVIGRSLGSMAGLYEAAMRSRNSGGPGGGGGRGGYGGGVQVLPASDYGGLAQVEAQANRQQHTQNLDFEANQAANYQQRRFGYDSALMNQAAYIQNQQRQDQQRQDQMAQQQFAQQWQQQHSPQPAPTFDANDKDSLARAQQDLAGLDGLVDAGEADEQEAAPQRQAINAKIATLQQKQQKASEFQQHQARDQQDQADGFEHVRGIREAATMMGPLAKNIYPIASYSDGSPKVVAYWDSKNHTMAIHNVPHEAPAKAEKPDKEEKWDDVKEWHAAETRAKSQVADVNSDAGKKELHSKTQAEFSQSRQGFDARQEARETAKLQKQANPRAVAGFRQLGSSLPQDQGKVDFNKASTQQLQGLLSFYQSPKAIGITDTAAAKAIAGIQQIIASRKAPPMINPPPPPRGNQAQPTQMFQYDAKNATPEARRRLTSGEALPEEIEWYKSTHGGQMPPGM